MIILKIYNIEETNMIQFYLNYLQEDHVTVLDIEAWPEII